MIPKMRLQKVFRTPDSDPAKLANSGISDSTLSSDMKSRSILSFLVIAVLSSSLTSCFSSSKVQSKNEASVGQQLTDLERAYQQGIINEKEYLKLKAAIIKNND